MNYLTTSAKIAGSPNNGVCSQAYDLSPDDQEKINTYGKLSLVLSGKGLGDSGQSILVIRGIAAQIQKKFFASDLANPLKSLVEAIETTLEQYHNEIELGALLIREDTSYIVASGGAKVVLNRNGSSVIFDSENINLYKASGQIQSGDLFVIATSAFFKTVSSGVFRAALDKTSPTKIADFLAPNIRSNDNNSDICAFFIKIDLQDFPNEAIPLEEKKNEQIQKQIEKPSEDKFRNGFIDKFKSKKFYIKDFQDEKTNKRRKILSFAGVLLLLILIGTIAFGLKRKEENDRVQRFEEVSAQVDRDLQEAEEIFAYSPQRAQEILNKSRKEVDTLQNQGIDQTQIDALYAKINQAEGDVLGFHNTVADLFVDLDLLSSGFDGDSITFYDKSVYVFDDDGDKLIKTDINSKRSEILAGQDVMENVIDVSAYSNSVYLLKRDGIYNLQNEKLIENDWSGQALMESYAGNIYILDKENSEIWRFSRDGEFFSPKSRWLASGVTADFSKVVSFAIDGAIWLFTSSSNVYRFTFGYQQNFSLDDVSPSLGTDGSLFVRSENQNIYILDRDNSRILVFDKEGRYQATYNQEMIKDARDIAVFEDEKKIILLTGDKLQYIDIQ